MRKNTKHRSSTRLSEAAAALAIVGGSFLVAAPSLAATMNVNLLASNQFDAATVTVQEGDTVTFTWQGGFHDVVFADGVSSGTPVGIDGTTFSRTFDAAGTYAYVCTVHESAGMIGTVIVESGAATATTAAPAAESTATTTAPAAGSTANAAPTGGTSGGATSQPFTGPERSLLPVAGAALVLGGVAMRLRLRRAG